MQVVFAILSTLNVAAAVALLVRIHSLHLRRTYKGLVAFLCLDAVGNGFCVAFGRGSRIYYDVFMLLLPVYAVLRYFMMREVFCEVYEEYSGLAVLVRKALHRSLLCGYGLALVAVPLTWPRWSDPRYHCWQFPAQEIYRFFTIGLLLYLVFMGNHLNKLPLSWPRNTRTLSCAYTALLSTSIGSGLIVLIAGNQSVNAACSLALVAMSIASQVYITALLEPLPMLGQRPKRGAEPDEKGILAAADDMNALVRLVSAGATTNAAKVFRRASTRSECVGGARVEGT